MSSTGVPRGLAWSSYALHEHVLSLETLGNSPEIIRGKYTPWALSCLFPVPWCPWHTYALCVLSHDHFFFILPFQNLAAGQVLPLHFSPFNLLPFGYNFSWVLLHFLPDFVMFDHHFQAFSVDLGNLSFDFVVLIWGCHCPSIWFNVCFNTSSVLFCLQNHWVFLRYEWGLIGGDGRPMHDRVPQIEHGLSVICSIMFLLFPWPHCTDCVYYPI